MSAWDAVLGMRLISISPAYWRDGIGDHLTFADDAGRLTVMRIKCEAGPSYCVEEIVAQAAAQGLEGGNL